MRNFGRPVYRRTGFNTHGDTYVHHPNSHAHDKLVYQNFSLSGMREWYSFSPKKFLLSIYDRFNNQENWSGKKSNNLLISLRVLLLKKVDDQCA